MKKVKSCGIILFRKDPMQFLVMQHRNRYDLPKGHTEGGESEKECAFRELEEETGIGADCITLDSFRFENKYYPKYKRFNNQTVEKTLVIFLAWLTQPCEVKVSEHQGFQWFPWPNEKHFKEESIRKLLNELKTVIS